MPKGGGDYLGIGLVEVMWKAVVVIINYHTKFQAGCGTETVTTEIKLLQKVATLREVVLHAILLDLHKAYNALYRFRCLEIMEGYGVGPRSLCLLRRYWEQLKMVAQAGGYHEELFHKEREASLRVTNCNPPYLMW